MFNAKKLFFPIVMILVLNLFAADKLTFDDLDLVCCFDEYCKDDYFESPQDILNLKLFKAIDEEDESKIRELLDSGANINVYMYYYPCEQTPLHRALHNKSLNLAKFLIKLGADVNAKDEYGETALHYAAKLGDASLAQYIIDFGAGVNAQRQGDFTPLHMAIEENQINLVKLLVKNGANIYAKDMLGRDAIVCSVIDSEIFKYFLDLGMDVNNPVVGNASLLHASVCCNNSDVAKTIIDQGICVDGKAVFGVTPLMISVCRALNIFFEDDDERYNVSLPNSLKMIDLLLQKDVDVNCGIVPVQDFVKQNIDLTKKVEIDLCLIKEKIKHHSLVTINDIKVETIGTNSISMFEEPNIYYVLDQNGKRFYLLDSEKSSGFLDLRFKDYTGFKSMESVQYNQREDFDLPLSFYEFSKQELCRDDSNYCRCIPPGLIGHGYDVLELFDFGDKVKVIACKSDEINKRDDLGTTILHRILFGLFMSNTMMEYSKDDLELTKEEIKEYVEDLILVYYFLLQNGASLDVKGYSPYELIKNNYDKFVEFVNRDDAPKDLPNLKKLLDEIGGVN